MRGAEPQKPAHTGGADHVRFFFAVLTEAIQIFFSSVHLPGVCASSRKRKIPTVQKDNRYFWWGKMDSNHRRHCQQIYSLSPLATREFPHMQFCQKVELVDGLEPPTC